MNLLSGYFHRCSYIVRPEEIVKKFAFLAVFIDIATLLGLTLFRMGIFGTTHGWGVEQKATPSLKSVTRILQWWNLTQLYLTYRRSKNYMNHVTHLLSSGDTSIFLPEISRCYYIKKYRYRFHFGTQYLILLTFLEPFPEICLINLVIILMMSAKW